MQSIEARGAWRAGTFAVFEMCYTEGGRASFGVVAFSEMEKRL